MIRRTCLALISLASLVLMGASPAQETASTRPKVRTITAFVRLSDPFESQISEALKVLKDAKSEFEQRGYQVETVRIVTQPLAELDAIDHINFVFVTRKADVFGAQVAVALADAAVQRSVIQRPPMSRDKGTAEGFK